MTRHKLNPQSLPQLTRDQKKRLHSLTEDEINAAARSDPDALPLDGVGKEKLIPIPNPRRVRRQLGMSQQVFARTYHLNLRTLQDWEQGRRLPDASTRTLLVLIQSYPDQIRDMVEQATA